MKIKMVAILCVQLLFGPTLVRETQAAILPDLETAILEKDYEKADQLASKFLADSPDSPEAPEARYYLGLSQLYQTQFAEARASFQKVLASRPNAALKGKATLGIIDAFLMGGDYEDALREAQNLERQDPNAAFMGLIYLKIARANLRLTNWAEARQYLEKITSQFPDSFEAHIAKQLLEEQQYFAVQVGSFLDRQRAEGLMNQLQQEGEYTYIVETADREGNVFYRVRVGQFSNLDQAEELKKKLSKVGYPTRIYP